MKSKEPKKKLGTGLSQLLVKDEELASVIKKPGRPGKKVKPGELKKNIKKLLIQTNKFAAPMTLPIHDLVAGKFQPRQNFDEQELENLAESIRENGVLQPILVRPINALAKKYEIIAGERRWRASQLSKLHEVPVIIRDFSDETALEVALVENLQRTDLNLLEEAKGYKMLMKTFSYTQDKLSQHLGKSRSHIANILRLLELPSQIKKLMVLGEITYGHARALLTLDDESSVNLANEVSLKGLSVRATENIVKRMKSPSSFNDADEKNNIDPNILSLEKDLTSLLGLKVKINNKANNKGSLQLFYNSLDQLEPVIDKLKWKPR